jgi:hypothetical protein
LVAAASSLVSSPSATVTYAHKRRQDFHNRPMVFGRVLATRSREQIAPMRTWGLATIHVKTSHLLENPILQGFQAKQLMSFFYDTKTTASDGWDHFGLNDTQKAAFL